MKYAFDTSPFVSLFNNFYPSTFVTLWQSFDELIEKEEIVSTREVFREIEDQDDELKKWAKDHKTVFTTPTAKEGEFVGRIYAVKLSLPFIPSCLPTTARLSGTDIILSQWIL